MNIKRIERLVAKVLISASYNISKMFKIKNKITFATFRTTNLTGNFKCIKDEVEMQGLNYTFTYLFKKFDKSLLGKADYLLHMITAGYYMATSKYFIIDDYYFPVYVIKQREGTNIIQVWHACGAFKKFGYDVLDKEYGASKEYISDVNIHSNYNAVIVSSSEVKKHYASAFNMKEENVYPIGIPRTDKFFNEKEKEEARNRVYERFPNLKDKKVILYAPTFRGKGQTDVNFKGTLNLETINRGLGKDTVFALKMHPFVSTRIKSAVSNIIDLSDYEDINDLLIVADVLITDYSSVIFEFSLMEKPIIMYANDKEDYIKERDFYYKYEDFVPGPITTTTEEVLSYIVTESYDLEKVRNFKNKFFDEKDGSSSKRFVDKFIK